jgi:hypothetical protein
MAKKGKAKNGNNKAKHSKLMAQKKNKLKKEAELRKTKLKKINDSINARKISDSKPIENEAKK